jgi:uncharacterized membrane protein HdeD (DUF308 family)
VRASATDVVDAVRETRKEWGWYLALGIALIAIGIIAIIETYSATIASVALIGVLLVAGGVLQTVGAFFARGAGHVVLLLLVGVVDIVVGAMLIQYPGSGALTLTLLLSVAFVAGGLFRFFAANLLQFPHYGWAAFSGVLTFILGILLWTQWPFSAEWFIGFAVGVNFIVAGIAWSTIALKIKPA